MKTKVKPEQKTEFIINKKTDDRFLAHFLSPIEIAATRADFQSFKYNLEGIEFDITSEVANDLLQLSFRRLRLFHEFVDKLTIQKLHSNPKYSKFLHVPLSDHKLSTRLYHCLLGNDCENMSDVLKLGKREISRVRGIGNQSLEEIKALLNKNKCIELFS